MSASSLTLTEPLGDLSLRGFFPPWFLLSAIGTWAVLASGPPPPFRKFLIVTWSLCLPLGGVYPYFSPQLFPPSPSYFVSTASRTSEKGTKCLRNPRGPWRKRLHTARFLTPVIDEPPTYVPSPSPPPPRPWATKAPAPPSSIGASLVKVSPKDMFPAACSLDGRVLFSWALFPHSHQDKFPGRKGYS